MSNLGEPLYSKQQIVRERSRGHYVFFVLVPLLALMCQVYVPLFVSSLAYLELPLLVTLHTALTRRSPVLALSYGCAVGLLQDALSNLPLGMYGIVKTLVGFFAANVSMRVDVENPLVRFLTSLTLYFFHQLFYWILARSLLGQQLDFDLASSLLFAVLNAAVAVPLFQLLDKLY
jgi:rod shape-determining protein MreD